MAYDEFCGEESVKWRGVGIFAAVDGCDCFFDSELTHIADGSFDSCDVAVLCEFDVVEAYDGDVFGCGEIMFFEAVEDTDGHVIVECEDSLWERLVCCEVSVHGVVAGVVCEVALPNAMIGDCDFCLFCSFKAAFEAFDGVKGVFGAGEDGDVVVVVVVDEMAHHVGSAFVVVHRDGGDVGAVDGAVDEYEF